MIAEMMPPERSTTEAGQIAARMFGLQLDDKVIVRSGKHCGR
jgi:hypothetical protein